MTYDSIGKTSHAQLNLLSYQALCAIVRGCENVHKYLWLLSTATQTITTEGKVQFPFFRCNKPSNLVYPILINI